MKLKDLPIQRKLMRVLLLTTCSVLILTFIIYFTYEFLTFRHSTIRQLTTLGRVIASNSTAALAFNNAEDAAEILSALKAEPHIAAAVLYDDAGNLFSQYPATAVEDSVFVNKAPQRGHYFEDGYLVRTLDVTLGDRHLGTLLLKSDTEAIYDRFMLFGGIAVMIITLSLLLAYLLSLRLKRYIAHPIMQLANTAKAISDRNDFSVRAIRISNDEIGFLTDAFNQMLHRIETQTDEITAFNQRLEERVIERTRELKAANRELEAFSYSVSHDLRAPLRSVHGYMNIFAEEYAAQLDDEGKRLINIILDSGRRMGQLIDDLLLFSQLGRKELSKGKVDMNALVSEIWREQRGNETGRQIEFVLKDMPTALADATTLKQVWTNLISNACKYTRDQDVATIEVGAYHEGKAVVYYIRDNGAGFDMKYYNKLFGVFQRLHSEEEFTGTGVGLAIVERVIAKHGGRIWAEAKVNEGATFYFTLTKAKVRSRTPV